MESRLTPSVTFAAQQTFAAGSGPIGVAVADLNGDGRPDLAAVNEFGPTVSVLLNTTSAGASTPSFTAQQTFAAGNTPFFVVAGDFNGDGRPDLAVANSGGATVSVLLNMTAAGAGIPTFAAQQTFAVGNAPRSVAAGDFSGDGRPDLAAANYNDMTVSVLLNTTAAGAGTPTFGSQQTFAAGNNPIGMAVGDFNGDGRPDLAAANFGAATVSVLLDTTAAGATTAAFAAQQTFAVGTNPQSVAAGNLDGDGRPDLAVVNFGGRSVSVLLNTTAAGAGTPSFAPQQTFAVGSQPLSVAAADFNGDGRPDLAVANGSSTTVSVLLDTTTPFASTVPVVVGQFGSQGVWEFNRALNTWLQLTAANASLLVAAPRGDIAAEFPGYGVWLYKPASGWKQINGVDATLLSIDPAGDVAAQFPGYGVGEFLPASGWRSLTPANATLLAMDAAGDVAAVFPGYGVQLFRPSVGWQQINGVDATLLAMDAQGDVVANFPGVGVGEYVPFSGWRLVNGTQAVALTIAGSGEVAAVFQGYGTAVYSPVSGWRTLAPVNASRAGVDGLGDVVGDFAGSGVWEYDPYRGWYQLTAADASLLAVA